MHHEILITLRERGCGIVRWNLREAVNRSFEFSSEYWPIEGEYFLSVSGKIQIGAYWCHREESKKVKYRKSVSVGIEWVKWFTLSVVGLFVYYFDRTQKILYPSFSSNTHIFLIVRFNYIHRIDRNKSYLKTPLTHGVFKSLTRYNRNPRITELFHLAYEDRKYFIRYQNNITAMPFLGVHIFPERFFHHFRGFFSLSCHSYRLRW